MWTQQAKDLTNMYYSKGTDTRHQSGNDPNSNVSTSPASYLSFWDTYDAEKAKDPNVTVNSLTQQSKDKVYDFRNLAPDLLFSNTSQFQAGDNLTDSQKKSVNNTLNMAENANIDLSRIGYTPQQLGAINDLATLSYTSPTNSYTNINKNTGNEATRESIQGMKKDKDSWTTPYTVNSPKFAQQSIDNLTQAYANSPAANRTQAVSPNSPLRYDPILEQIRSQGGGDVISKPVTDVASKILGTGMNFFNIAPDWIVQIDRARNERLSGVGGAPEDLLSLYPSEEEANRLVDVNGGKYARWYADLMVSDPERANMLSQGATGVRGVGRLTDSWDAESGIAGGLQDIIKGGMYAVDNFGKNTVNTWNGREIVFII